MIREPNPPPFESTEPDIAWGRFWTVVGCLAFWALIVVVIVKAWR